MTAVLPWSGRGDHHCFGCSPANPAGLRLEFTEEDDALATQFLLDSHYESYPGVVHGGILALIADETMGNLVVLRLGVPALTTSLRTRYVGIVSVGRRYRCLARATERDGLVSATAEILDSRDAVVATATAGYKLRRSHP